MTLNERLQAIKARWQSIREQDPELRVPGAMFHHYHLDQENVPRQGIENFEKHHSLSLPEEYREYLMQVTNGGVGPYHVMYPLHDALYPLCRGQRGEADHYDWFEHHPEHYAAEFPVTEEQIMDYLRYKINHASLEGYAIELEAAAPGYLFLCTAAPGRHYIMPVKGACINEVWVMEENTRVGRDGQTENYFRAWPEVRFKNDQISTLNFLEWIEDAQQNWFNADTSLDHRLAAVRTTWFNLAAHDKEHSVFGAFIHHYQLSHVLNENELTSFEKRHQFTLPGEYRRYLKLVSNGGAGPFYGMYSLQHSLIALNSGSRDEGTFINYLEKNPDHFSKPFPVSDEQVNEYLTRRIADPSSAIAPVRIRQDAGGYLFLCEYGCGGYYIMPVNGNGAGEVWFLQKMDGNKLSYEVRDDAGNLVGSGSYGNDTEADYFELYPELKWNQAQASTVNFLEWLEYRQRVWFAEEAEETRGAGEDLDNSEAYYPLAVGNTWTQDYGGKPMITTIESCNEAGEYTIVNSLNPVKGLMKKVNGEYFSDGTEKGNMQLVLRDVLAVGDSWEATFRANGLDCIYVYTVKEVLPSLTVAGKAYQDVAMVELDSYYVINGARMSMNAFTQTYYAKGVGPVLTTTSGVIGNNSYPLQSFELKDAVNQN